MIYHWKAEVFSIRIDVWNGDVLYINTIIDILTVNIQTITVKLPNIILNIHLIIPHTSLEC